MAHSRPELDYHTANKRCYFTLENGDRPDIMHTSGDIIQAKFHLDPLQGESMSVSNITVNFKCEVSTLITTGSGKDSRTYKHSAYLFCYSTVIINHNPITINSPKVWSVSFQFPWQVQPTETQISLHANPKFPYQAGDRLPPTWRRLCTGNPQSVRYYLESTMTRSGRIINHNDVDQIPLLFSPLLDIPSPDPYHCFGMNENIIRTSWQLDPAKHHGFRERTKAFFAYDDDTPTASFSVTASTPTVCCVEDRLPIKLHITYNEKTSTAPEQPAVTITGFYVRINDYIQYRVPYDKLLSKHDMVRESNVKISIGRYSNAREHIVYDGLSLDEWGSLSLPPSVGPSFSTFSVRREYTLKVSANLSCAGKSFEVVVIKHPLTVHPHRSLYRGLPGPSTSVAQPGASISKGDVGHGGRDEDQLPPYTASSSQQHPQLPMYGKGDF
ncbi:MAG: hypothetical protein Q9168_003934 [Polycauliona sp. 1 TL-2023]